MRRLVQTLIPGLFMLGTAHAGGFQAHTPSQSPFQAVGSEVSSSPSQPSIDYRGRATIHAKYRFVYNEEFEQNPQLYLLPDRDSKSIFPYLTRQASESIKVGTPEKVEEIWVKNVAEAADALLGKPLAAEMMAGKHEQLNGEAVVVIDGFSAGYECDAPSFATRFVAVKREIAAPAATKPELSGC